MSIDSRPLSSKEAGDRVEATVIQSVPGVEHVSDTVAPHHDAVTTAVLEPSNDVLFRGICLLEPDTAIEIKSAIAVLESGQRGRFHIQRTGHAALLAAAGSYLFAVCAPTPDREVVALAIVPASLVDELLGSWYDAGDSRTDEYTQLAWSRVFSPQEVER